MSREIKICNQPLWFLAEPKKVDGSLGYPIFYRYAISYSIAQNISKPEKDYKWISEEMEKLINCFKNKEVYICPDFLELYPLVDNKGFVLVDQTDSYYPLMIYDERLEKEDKKSRVYPFGKSLEDINNNLEKIYNKLLELIYDQVWDQEFQTELRKLFTY